MTAEYIMNRLNIYKTHQGVKLPTFATKGSACFDLAFQDAGAVAYKGFNAFNAPFTRNIHEGRIVIMPGDRVLVPTGYIFDIPVGYSVRIHARSGLSLKAGLVLANAEAVIDCDYVEETFIMLLNISENQQFITSGDRIAQAELVKSEEYVLWETPVRPFKKTDRVGGLGSTGVADITYNTTGQVSLAVIPEAQTTFTEEEPAKRGRGRPKKTVSHHPV